MHEEFRPVDQLGVDLCQGFFVVARQLDPLPPLRGEVCALDGLEVKAEGACGWVRPHGGVARVGERARLPAAEAREVVFVATEGLGFGVESAEGAQ